MEKDHEEKLMAYYNKLKQQPLFDETIELGKMLMRHIDSLSPEERKRYDELTELLIAKPKT